VATEGGISVRPATGAIEGAPEVLAIMLTRRCDIACGHCSVVSGPDVRDEPDAQQLLAAVRDAAAAGVRLLQLTGGEPMLREEIALAMVREASRLGIGTAMTTNGSWGATPDDARRRLRALVDAGLRHLTVSYDRWHEAELGFAPVLNVARAASEISFVVQVNIVRGADDRDVGALAERMTGFPSVRLRFYDAQPVGRAKSFRNETLRSEVAGFCRAAWFPALTDDGRVTACNGPAYFQKPGSPLVLGSMRDAPLAELLARHRDDPIVASIRALGPTRLREELARLPGFEGFPFRERYGGMCDLCLHLTSDPAAVAALRERLSDPRIAAERAATVRVIESARRDGEFGTRHANGVGAARLFFDAARSPSSALPRSAAARVFGRSDFDWKRRAEYLAACGFARPLAHALDDPELARWAPRFFVEDLRRAGARAAIADLVKGDALARVDEALAAIGTHGVLLKGTALLVSTAAADRGRLRATGDVDIVVPPPAARRLRADLLASGGGFEGACDGGRSAAHHLAPVSFRGVAIEIHERILPRSFGLPEEDMLARARAVPGTRSLRVLDPEGFVLHALFHCTAHVFAFGLKTAWDVAWTLDATPDLDWDRVERWARGSRLSRAFWTPLRALAEPLALAIPRTVLAGAPADRRQRALDTIARERVFRATEGPFELNPFSKTAAHLLLCDSWRARAAHVAELAHGEAAEARREARRHAPAQSLARLPQQLREVAFHWRAFREATLRS